MLNEDKVYGQLTLHTRIGRDCTLSFTTAIEQSRVRNTSMIGQRYIFLNGAHSFLI